MWGKAMAMTTRSVTYMELAMMTVAMTRTRWVRLAGSFLGLLVITSFSNAAGEPSSQRRDNAT